MVVDPGAGLLLGLGPMRSVGRVSYSLYLWHWPPLVLVPIAIGAPLSPAAGVLVVALSAVPAVLSYRFVEEPFRHSSALVEFPRRARRAGRRSSPCWARVPACCSAGRLRRP